MTNSKRRLLTPILVSISILIVLITAVVVVLYNEANNSSIATQTNLSLPETTAPDLPSSKQIIGGSLKVTEALSAQTLTLSPSNSSAPTAGQIYMSSDGSLNYYNGTNNINISSVTDLLSQPGVGLTVQNGELSNSGVLTMQGQTGNISLTGSNGITVSGTTITNTGVTSLAGQTGNVSLGNGLQLNNGKLEATSVATLPQELNVASSPTFNKLNLSTALGIANGGTGSSSLTMNSILVGQGTSKLLAVTPTSIGQCLVSTAGAPSFQACPGSASSSGVDSINNLTGLITIATITPTSLLTSGNTITLQDATSTVKGLAAFNSTNLTVNSGVVNTVQGIATSSTPTFAGLSLTTALAITNGGTGANNSTTARSNLGAAASGVNTDITQLNSLASINPTSSLTVGNTSNSLTLQGSATSISSTSGSFKTNLDFVTPTANTTYRLQTAAAGVYDLCTTAGNCVGVGGSVTTAGGVTNTLAKFTNSNAIGDSIITDNGTTVTINGNLAVNTISPTTGNSLTIGSTTQNLTLQGATTNLTSTAAGITNKLTFATPSATNKTITIPNATGTIAVSASGPLVMDANGNLSCPSCLTSGVAGGETGVTSVNNLTGLITIATITPTSLLTSGNTITLQDATSTVKGLAAFNSTNLTVNSGVVNTVQNINTTATPTFNNLNLTNALGITNGGTGLGSTPTAGQLLVGNGSGYSLTTLTAGTGISIANTSGAITISSASSGDTYANQSLSNLTTTALNTSLLPATNNSIDLGSSSAAFRNGYIAGVLQANSLDTTANASLAIGSTNATSIALNQNTTIADNKSLTASGSVLFKNATDSASAFQVQASDGDALLTANTETNGVIIGASQTTVENVKLTVNASPSSVAQLIQSSYGQTADLLQVKDSDDSTMYSIGATGNILFKNNTNSTSAFQVQQANGTSVFGVDTTNGRIGIGTATPANKLSLNNLTTADSTAQLAIGTGEATNKGLVIQATADQTADLFQTQDSTGTTLASISATGALTTQDATVNGTALFKNTTDTSSAFQVQDSTGLSLFKADTANGGLTVGDTSFKADVFSMVKSANYATDNYSYSVTSADFNADGKADLVVANYASNTVSILLGTGTGTFATKVDYTTGTSPRFVTSADFNADGKADLVVANYNSKTVSVLLGTGTGTFAAKVDYATGSYPRSVTSSDFNADGKADLAVSNYSSKTVSVLLGTGTGTFVTKVDYATGTNPYSVTSADFNADGKADLAVANSGSNTVSILLGTGTGTFSTKVDYATGNYPRFVTSSDFNADGKVDLAVANNTSSTVSILLGTGTGTFATKVDYATGTNPQSITSADFNGDGNTDLAVANYDSSTVSILLGTGTGTFAAKVDYATGTNPPFVTSADFNADGKADLAVANRSSDTVSVLLNTSTIYSTPKLTVNASPSSVAQLIQSSYGQTADLLQVKDSDDSTMYSIGATGNILFKNNTNSTSAFQVQQANGTSVFGVDTTNGRIGIGTATPANKLSLNNLTTADSTAQLAIGTGAATNKGLVIQATVDQTADLLQAQSSTGETLFSISSTGNLTITSATIANNLTVNGHIVTGGSTPTITAGTAACTTPTVLVEGTDTAGTITITSGTGCTETGELATVSFNAVFGDVPRVILTSSNINSVGLVSFNDSASTDNFTVDTSTTLTDTTTYVFNYLVIQ